MAIMIPVGAVLAVCHPLKANPWRGGRVTEALVRRQLKYGCLQPRPVMPDASPYMQAARIAYLAEKGWEDPIQIDVGVPSLRCYVDWPVIDGNHRLAAAVIRGDEMILAEISGSTRHAANLFGIAESSI